MAGNRGLGELLLAPLCDPSLLKNAALCDPSSNAIPLYRLPQSLVATAALIRIYVAFHLREVRDFSPLHLAAAEIFPSNRIIIGGVENDFGSEKKTHRGNALGNVG